MTAHAHNLIWIDLEMTGLNVEQDRIIEIATIVTDSSLNVLAEGPVFAIHQSDEQLAQMDDWNTKQHHESGLVACVKHSQTNEQMAQQATLEFLRAHVPIGKSPMCGNSVWQDRRFLARYMPELEQYFHYRLIDVSTLKELARRWAPSVYNGLPQKNPLHRAPDDTRDSIAELRYYRDHLFKSNLLL
jgi:oligoribonuclease